MTEREVIEAIKAGRPFMLTASGPASARGDVLEALQRCTNMALAEMRRDIELLRREVLRLRAASDEAREQHERDLIHVREAHEARRIAEAKANAAASDEARDA
jgi:hypothetical protein